MSTFYQLLVTGKLGFFLILSITFAIVQLVILPSYYVDENDKVDPSCLSFRLLFSFLSTSLPSFVLAVYNPETDHAFNMIALGALSGYYIMSAACTLLDLIAPTSWKTQESKSYFSLRQWLQAIIVSSLNLWLSSHLVTLPTWWMHKHGVLRSLHESDPTVLTQFSAPWDWRVELPKQLFHVLFIDAWFFSTHRLIHVSRPVNLYKWIHKFHHTFTAPCASACMYANPLEFCLGNVMGIILGPCITNCHPLTTCGWLTFALVSTSATHSGYTMLGAETHDHHHEHFDYNYGTDLFMDRLFGTVFIGSEKHRRVEERKERTRREAASKKE